MHEISIDIVENIDTMEGRIIQIDDNSLILDYGKGLKIINLKDIIEIKEI